MKQGWGRTLQIAFTYMGAVIGAGFASGQEAIQFFLVFGYRGLWGIILATALLAFFGALTLYLTRATGIDNYRDFINIVLGKRIGKWTDLCLAVFLWTGLAIMLAGSGSVFAEHLAVSPYLGTTVTALMVAMVLLGGVNRVVWLNTALVPILVGVALVVIATGLTRSGISAPLPEAVPPMLLGKTWWIASILYVSYNLAIGTVLLVSLGDKGTVAGGVLGGLGLGVVLMAMAIALELHYPAASQYEVPMLYVAGVRYPGLRVAYALVLWFAMATTAVADGYGLASRLASRHLPYPAAVVMVIVCSLPLTRYGFARMVGSVYPLFGYIGIVILAGLGFQAWQGVRNKKAW